MSKLTKEQLQGVSDFEVNKTLAELLGKKVEQHSIFNVGLQWCFVDGEGNLYRMSDYCNTPNDIMPLAFEYELNIHKNRYGDPEWICSSRTNRYFEHANPLRAIACCLILVLQEGK